MGKGVRKSISLSTYSKIHGFFMKNPDKQYSATALRDGLKVDYLSLLFALRNLQKQKAIVKSGNKYWLEK